jgi:hypothetical protein
MSVSGGAFLVPGKAAGLALPQSKPKLRRGLRKVENIAWGPKYRSGTSISRSLWLNRYTPPHTP